MTSEPVLPTITKTLLYHTYNSISQGFEEQLLENRLENIHYRKKNQRSIAYCKLKIKQYKGVALEILLLHVYYFSKMPLDNHLSIV